MTDPEFDLDQFLPYLLNQAAEATSRGFQPVYAAYGMTRTQWRVLANLGRFGAMTATAICAASHVEKTKVSRAVTALEGQGLLQRAPDPQDGRAEVLRLTDTGRAVFAALGQEARQHDQALRDRLGGAAGPLEAALRRLIAGA
ncbi:MarR family transcriptional regulator [Tabrizicola sp. TH137]|uniref:MarR family winged helix-turn-helix transcriptional regulator n=1 Tax=Tabrizicola sp. TH137 TaxID=2067452 RepID=UPI000C7C532D|nr:MarR family transcriptional regulator [Tabrizicola sp. TH137]PLL10396.1 MarR family transcriptional regulator [Tabrizicola sp. TH137]